MTTAMRQADVEALAAGDGLTADQQKGAQEGRAGAAVFSVLVLMQIIAAPEQASSFGRLHLRAAAA